MVFSELEKRIALELYKKPRTAEELSEVLGEEVGEVMEALKKMIKLRVVKKKGFPPVYSLSESITEAIKMGEEAEEGVGIRVHGVVEVQGVEEGVVKKGLEEVKNRLKGEKGIFVEGLEFSSIEKMDNGMYSGYVDVTVRCANFESLMRFVLFYGPSVIEVEEEGKVEFEVSDLQEGLLLLSEMVQGYVSYITRLMSRKEIEEFNKKLLGLR